MPQSLPGDLSKVTELTVRVRLDLRSAGLRVQADPYNSATPHCVPVLGTVAMRMNEGLSHTRKSSWEDRHMHNSSMIQALQRVDRATDSTRMDPGRHRGGAPELDRKIGVGLGHVHWRGKPRIGRGSECEPTARMQSLQESRVPGRGC